MSETLWWSGALESFQGRYDGEIFPLYFQEEKILSATEISHLRLTHKTLPMYLPNAHAQCKEALKGDVIRTPTKAKQFYAFIQILRANFLPRKQSSSDFDQIF